MKDILPIIIAGIVVTSSIVIVFLEAITPDVDVISGLVTGFLDLAMAIGSMLISVVSPMIQFPT